MPGTKLSHSGEPVRAGVQNFSLWTHDGSLRQTHTGNSARSHKDEPRVTTRRALEVQP